ncbi:hypothetical protein AB3Y40_06665 [Yoonia sp. R2331]|uniref:hypothetical protein n=1 Tax=Yoonia sp. R2331 TaxID=3237238 RepID=UPI0034E61971
MQHQTTLIDAVETFLAESGMGETYFGKLAARNSELVKRLRSGGRVWPETEAEVRDFIDKNSPESDAPSSAAAQPGGSLPSHKRLGGEREIQGEPGKVAS